MSTYQNAYENPRILFSVHLFYQNIFSGAQNISGINMYEGYDYIPHYEYPPYDGWYNNLASPNYGAAGKLLKKDNILYTTILRKIFCYFSCRNATVSEGATSVFGRSVHASWDGPTKPH